MISLYDYFVNEIPLVDLWGLLVIILGFLRWAECLVAEFCKEASLGTINWVAKFWVMGILSNRVFLLAAVVAAAAISDKTVLFMGSIRLVPEILANRDLALGPNLLLPTMVFHGMTSEYFGLRSIPAYSGCLPWQEYIPGTRMCNQAF